jgi:uroporphyrinogen decarboxylase
MMHRLVRACLGEEVDCTPVWFMRQAGRYLPGYREARRSHSVLEIIRRPQLAAQVAVEPVLTMGFDAAIIFSDIVLPLTTMGVDVDLRDNVGPVVKHPIRGPSDVHRLHAGDPGTLEYVYDQIRLLRESDLKVPIIGFAGAPFTLASYLVEGGYSRTYEYTKYFMYTHTDAWNKLMAMLSQNVAGYLKAQIRAGVHIIQLFDSWVGALSPVDFREYVKPHLQEILNEVVGVPKIYFGTTSCGILGDLGDLEFDVLGVDWRVDIGAAWSASGKRAVQGNLDPAALLAGSEVALRGTRHILAQVGGRPGHIFNLGHGVLPQTDPVVVKTVVDYVHANTQR